ncbi:MAG TPA: hypothetical protein VGO93_14445 [Candidatus Xenobia bacterium]
MAVSEEKVKQATDALGQALSMLSPKEKEQLATLRKQVDDASGMAGQEFDKRLEFCYAILFTPEIANERLKSAARLYIDAHGG